MYCTQCGNPNPDGVKNCVVCGAQLMGAAPTEPEAAPQPAPAEPEAAPQPAPEELKTDPQNNGYSQPAENYSYNSDSAYSAPAQEPAPSYAPYHQNSYQSGYAEPTFNYSAVPQELPGKTLGIVSMVLGIVAAVIVITFFCCYLTLGFLPLGLGIAAVITGNIAKKKAKAVGMKNGYATTGFICGLISAIIGSLGLIFLVLYFILIGSMFALEPTDSYVYFISNFLM